MKRFVLALAVPLALVGCGEESELPTMLNLAPEWSGAALEHVLEVEAVSEGGTGHFTVTSTLRNDGAEPISLVGRSCYIRQSDVRGSTAGLELHEPLMLCASAGHALTLAPGETSEVLLLTGTAAPGATHHVEIRHALYPERWTPVSLRIP